MKLKTELRHKLFKTFKFRVRRIAGGIIIAGVFLPMFLIAQSSRGPSDFPELIMAKISGAPRLDKPVLVTGTATAGGPPANNRDLYRPTTLGSENFRPLISQGFGLAAPAFWDWDGDGLRDLLIGEFESGSEFGRAMGNFIRVYLNIGTESEPAFTGSFEYAMPPYEILTNGTPYSVDQYCCMGFTPQFIDLNNDGFADMVSGQYYGEVVSFFGSENGFLPGQPLKQEGNPRDNSDMKHWVRVMQAYWHYSSANLGDFTGDGKLDLIVGGIGGLRISKNIGTSTEPKFALRELLLDTKGEPLKVYDYTQDENRALKEKILIPGLSPPYIAGDYQTSPVVADWDQDGVLDLLVTNHYDHKGLSAIDFFRGVKVNGEHRFEPRTPLFRGKSGEKSLPGTAPRIFVTDWNNDGVSDLLIGTSVVVIRDKFNSHFSWSWEKETGLMGPGRDPGLFLERNSAAPIDWLVKDVILPNGISSDDFKTLRHQGYVYIMLGIKEKEMPVRKQTTGNR